MTEERKYAIVLAATLLPARKLMESMEADNPNLAKQYFASLKHVARKQVARPVG